MNKIIKILALVAFAIALVYVISRTRQVEQSTATPIMEEKCATTASESLAQLRVDSPIEVTKNGSSIELAGVFNVMFSVQNNESDHIDISLRNISDTSYLYKLEICDVLVEGRAYDALINNRSKCANLTNDGKTENVTASVKGRVRVDVVGQNQQPAEDVTSVSALLNCDLEIEYSDSERNEWCIVIHHQRATLVQNDGKIAETIRSYQM